MVAAVAIAVAVLGVLFGLVQLVRGPQSSTVDSSTAAARATVAVPGVLPTIAPPADSLNTPATPGPIQSTARPLDPNYTVAQGDTLVQIAARFSTTTQRIQALNSLADPRSLSIGQKLVIPPSL